MQSTLAFTALLLPGAPSSGDGQLLIRYMDRVWVNT